MKKCPYCGSQIADDCKFCSECGKEYPNGNTCRYCGALIYEGDVYCENCGKKIEQEPISTVSEQSFKSCPHCGAKLEPDSLFCGECGKRLDEAVQVAEPKPIQQEPTPFEEVEDNVISDEYEEQPSSLKQYLPYIIGVLVVCALVGGSWYGYNEYTAYSAKKEAREKFVKDSLEQARKDSIKLAEQKEIARKDSLEKARIQLIQQPYLALLDKYGSQDDNWGQLYFLFDITSDGLPEIWMNIREGEDYKFCVYSCQNGNAKLLFKDELGFNSSFYQGDNYILMGYAHMGYQVINKFVLDKDIIKIEKIYETEEDTSMEEAEYKEIKEPLITTYEITDKNPIYEIK